MIDLVPGGCLHPLVKIVRGVPCQLSFGDGEPVEKNEDCVTNLQGVKKRVRENID